MNKIFALIAVLVLFAGTAFAGNLTDLQTAELAADTKGRGIVSGETVILRIWNTDATLNAKIGITGNTSILFYESGIPITGSRIAGGTSIDTLSAGYDTIGEVVDAINADTSGLWKASVGRDGYRAMSAKYLTSQSVTADSSVTGNSVVGTTEDNAATVMLDPNAATFISVGIAAKDNTTNRIKAITHSVGGTGNITARIYDGDTVIWRKDIGASAYNDQTVENNGASPNTVNFSDISYGKGIAGSRGKSLVLQINRTTLTFNDDPEESLSIVYDQLVK